MLNNTLLEENYLNKDEAYHIARCDLNSREPECVHDHDYFEMFLVEAGSVNHRVNGREQRLDKGTLVFVRPADAHALWSSGSRATIVNLLFTADTARHIGSRYHSQFACEFFWSTEEFPQSIELNEWDQLRLSKDLARLISGPRHLANVEGFLTQFLALRTNEESSQPDMPHWLREALLQADKPQFLQQGARGLSEACGRSHEHVCRVVKRHLNQTASEIMNGRRMGYAAKLLVSSSLPVTEIAQACGIENMSYFFRLFKDFHGMTPKSFREFNRRNPINPSG